MARALHVQEASAEIAQVDDAPRDAAKRDLVNQALDEPLPRLPKWA